MEQALALNMLKDQIHRDRNLDVNQYKENYLKRRLAVRMRALQIEKYEDYCRYLLENDSEYAVLLDKLTINVTQFFRDEEMFEVFESEILPNMLKEGKGFKIWSAGCSTGEEPYSIAVSIEESAEKAGLSRPEYLIYATDIDSKALYSAVAGSYKGRTLDNVKQARKEKYFSVNGEEFTVKETLKERIKFIKFNLMEPYKRGFFEVVFCRNVIIYFTKELQKRVMEHFYDSLKEGGVLILGKTETMLQEFREKFECVNLKERMFRKRA
ncbi:MAG TPA: protein-glutamate O-methyltransferase CheR [bacterium]|nr:protein-glutamate O-methyltransferase CheR [bacterium]